MRTEPYHTDFSNSEGFSASPNGGARICGYFATARGDGNLNGGVLDLFTSLNASDWLYPDLFFETKEDFSSLSGNPYIDSSSSALRHEGNRVVSNTYLELNFHD